MSQPANYFPYWGKARPEDENGSNYHLLVYHCLDVAAVGWACWEAMPLWRDRLSQGLALPEDEARKLVCFLLAIHDLGKFSPQFQRASETAWRALQPGKPPPTHYIPYRHDALGLAGENLHHWLQEAGWARPGPEVRDILEYFFLPLIAAVTGHHGRCPVSIKPRELACCFDRESQSAAAGFVGTCAAHFHPDLGAWEDDPVSEPQLCAASYLLAGYAILCDWLGSNQGFFPYQDRVDDLWSYWEKTIERARTALAATHLIPPAASPRTGLKALFPDYLATALQREAESLALHAEKGPYLFVAEDLTGSGKTEAALVLAHRLMALGAAHGMFFALPTMATADQMYDRLAKAYQKLYLADGARLPSLVLAHGQRDLSQRFSDSIGMELKEPPKDLVDRDLETAGAMCAGWLADNNKKALLGAVGVGTVDQAMLAVLRAKHGMLRLLGLTGKVLILDEIHAYDAYMLQILKTLLRFHASNGGSAVLLSATLPARMREGLVDAFYQGVAQPNQERALNDAYPMLTVAGALSGRQAIPFAVPEACARTIAIELLEEAPIEMVVNLARAGACVCWVRNTVDDAVEAFEELGRHLEADKLSLFHARFAMGHRLDIQDELVKRFGRDGTGARREGRVVVATQVVEQSLDVDFDRVISDLAPIDLLLQRLGRQQRHCRDGKGKVLATGGGSELQDARGLPLFAVYVPPFTEEPGEDWYAQTFPGADHVYKYTLQLWLTQRVLRARPRIRLPEDVRGLIESVYEPEADDIPPGLEASDINRDAQESADRTRARHGALSLAGGYRDTSRGKSDEEVATRLGLDTVTLRLAVWDGCRLKPLVAERQDWRYSQVRVAAYRIGGALPPDEDAAAALAELSETLPDRNKGVLFVILQPDGAGWKARGHKNEEPLAIHYDARLGLRIMPAP